MTLPNRSWLLLVLIMTLLVACTNTRVSNPRKNYKEFSAEKIYELAVEALESAAYNQSIRLLQLIEERFPFERIAEQAHLELIYAYYQVGNYTASHAVAKRFIRLHPKHPNVDYAYYMQGLVAFSEDTSIFGKLLPTDSSLRDSGTARESYSHFASLLTLFPNSAYAKDAQQRIIFLRNLLARSEINVANYYFKRGAYVAAIARGRYVVENFQGSPAIPDGLAVMAQGYKLLGYDKLAQNSIEVLRLNYPEHPALDQDGNLKEKDIIASQKRSWLYNISFGLLDIPDPLGYDTRYLFNEQYTKPPK